MRFSEFFEVERCQEDDWFDPDLAVDTRLFLDPFLLLDEVGTNSMWADAHGRLIEHFARCFDLLARSPGPGTNSAKAAEAMLTFPEPAELCLGYTTSGTSGAGSGHGGARLMLNSIIVALAAGLNRPEHIEEIGILNEGIGADRISDAACNVLKPLIIRYTKDVAQRHGIPISNVRVRRSRCSPTSGRWLDEDHVLPVNPSTGRAILLIPSRLLNRLPVLNADDWFNSSFNADLRRDLNIEVGAKVSKSKIVEAARRHPERIRQWADDLRSVGGVRGYDFDADPLGIIRWHKVGGDYARSNPLANADVISNSTELGHFVDELLGHYRRFIEHEGGWRLLWNDDGSEKPEEAAQLALLGLARLYCRVVGVELDREVNLGRGPVDFKLSCGSRARVLIELKKLHNGDFWNGLDHQLPSYMESDDCEDGWLLAVQYRAGGISAKRRQQLPRRVSEIAGSLGKKIRFAVVDAGPKASASKIGRS